MATANFNVRLEQGLKDRAFPVLERYGLTPAQAFKLFLNQVAETKVIPLSFDWGKESILTAEAEARLQQSMKEIEMGEYDVIDSNDPQKALLELAK